MLRSGFSFSLFKLSSFVLTTEQRCIFVKFWTLQLQGKRFRWKTTGALREQKVTEGLKRPVCVADVMRRLWRGLGMCRCAGCRSKADIQDLCLPPAVQTGGPAGSRSPSLCLVNIPARRRPGTWRCPTPAPHHLLRPLHHQHQSNPTVRTHTFITPPVLLALHFIF